MDGFTVCVIRPAVLFTVPQDARCYTVRLALVRPIAKGRITVVGTLVVFIKVQLVSCAGSQGTIVVGDNSLKRENQPKLLKGTAKEEPTACTELSATSEVSGCGVLARLSAAGLSPV